MGSRRCFVPAIGHAVARSVTVRVGACADSYANQPITDVSTIHSLSSPPLQTVASEMPRCKNDPHRYYKGTEASPMGNGWCARADPDGKVRIGTDRKQWVVTQTGASTRWTRVAGRTGGRGAVACASGPGNGPGNGSGNGSGTGPRGGGTTRSPRAPRTTGTAGATAGGTAGGTKGTMSMAMSMAPEFAVIRCGYTDRLLLADGHPNAELQQVLENSDEVELAFVAGGDETVDFVSPLLPKRLERRGPGEIVVKVRDVAYRPLAAIFTFVENLMDLDHCGFFHMGSLSDMVWDGQGKVIELTFPTESA